MATNVRVVTVWDLPIPDVYPIGNSVERFDRLALRPALRFALRFWGDCG
jgi:hypothetical protein